MPVFVAERIDTPGAWQMPQGGIDADEDPRAAVDWAWPRVPEPVKEEFVSDLVRREWSKRDKAGANAWLEANGFEPES